MLEQFSPAQLTTFGCPTCRGSLEQRRDSLLCPRCQASYVEVDGYLDFAPAVAMKAGLGPFYLQDPLHVPRYEQRIRSAFVSIMGQNWQGTLSPEGEDAYIRDHLVASDGLVLDLGCGAGRWTRTVSDHVGIDRVIGLDLSAAMLNLIRVALPDLRLIRASALRLPFRDGSLSGVNCSNALQLFPSPDLALSEVGRCLRPGGILTAFTFRQAYRPAYRYFQKRHETTFNVRAFRPAEITNWLDAAGMDLLDLSGPVGNLLFAARRRL
jgi:ubiquinone/menaquinone biosynthesis C-methylase UbiE